MGRSTKNTKRGQVSRRRRWLKIFGITILAFLLSLVFFQPFAFSLTSLVSIPERSDFDITDFYAIVADSRPIKTLDRKILIVDISRSDRDEIADVLDILSFCDPLAVGMDVIFETPRDGEEDEYLLTAVRNCPNLVIATALAPDSLLSFRYAETSFFQDSLGTPGAINLAAKYPRATIREFPVWFPSGNDTIPSFVTAIARFAAPDAAAFLHKRDHRHEIINYPSRKFEIIKPENLIDHAEDIHNRVVLIGAVEDFYDIHSTPIDSRMAGVLIHAYSLSTILEDNYITELNKFQNWLLAFLACLIVIFVSVKLTSGVKGIVLRVTQLLILYLALVIGYHFFITYNILINFSYILLILSFGLFACDIWNGFETGIPKVGQRYRRLKARIRYLSLKRTERRIAKRNKRNKQKENK